MGVSAENIIAGKAFARAQDSGNDIDMRFMITSSTNPLPRACGVYLYSDADNVHFNESATHITSANVVGYRECEELVVKEDQNNAVFTSAVIGECIDCIIKEYAEASLPNDDKKTKAQNGILIYFLMIGGVCSFAVVWIYVFYRRQYPKTVD